MADDIKIKVGVQNNVKAGMDGVVSDVDRARGKIDRSMRGKGFMEAFSKALRGDISGALEDLQERMGKGMNGIAAKALVWGGGIATALFAGFKAGKELDKMFGISDKLGGMLANRFGVQEDTGLKAELEGLRAARKQREDDAKAAIELKKQVLSEGIKAIETENQAIAEQGVEANRQANQRARDQRNFQDQAAGAGVKRGIVARILGRPDFDMQGAADRDMKAALDDDFRKQEKQAERQVDQAEKRRKKLLVMARDAGAEGRKRSPQLQRVWDAEQKATDAADVQRNLDALQKRALDAAEKAAHQAEITAANTRRIKDLQEQLLTLK